MNQHISIRNLQIIVAFDSLSYGLLYRYFPEATIINLGGTHITVALYLTGVFVAKIFAPEVTTIFTDPNGKRYGLFFILTITIFSQLMMAVSKNYWFLIFMRILFSAVDQTQDFCLELLLEKEQNINNIRTLCLNYAILSGSGFILGPIIAGFIFDRKDGFRHIGTLAAVLTLVNIILLSHINDEGYNNNNIETKSLLVSKIEYKKTIKALKKAELKKNWDILLMQYLFASSLLIFSTDFTKILSYSYQITSSLTIGLTIAYMNALVFVFNNYAYDFKTNIDCYPIVFVSELLYFMTAVFMVLMWYAPCYGFFLLLIVPIIFLRSLINTLWDELFSERNNKNLNKLNNNSVLIAAGSTMPIMFGTVCNQINHNAVIIFTVAPLLLCWYITKFYSRFLEIKDLSVVDPCSLDEDNCHCETT